MNSSTPETAPNLPADAKPESQDMKMRGMMKKMRESMMK